jgi:hypothetical protein
MSGYYSNDDSFATAALTGTQNRPHEITLVGGTILRDNRKVLVKANTRTRAIKVGCTWVSREALLKICEWSTTCNVGDEKVLQEGLE